MWFAQRNRSARAPDPPRFARERQAGGPRPDAVQGPALPAESTVHFVLDLAIRIGGVQMSSGAGASDATATILAVANAYGLPHCEVDVIFTSITVTCHRGVDHPPITSLRAVRSCGLDYTRLALVERLVTDTTRGRVTAREAHIELNELTTAPHPYPRWLATLAYAGMAAAVALLIGGDAVMAGFAGLITALQIPPLVVAVSGMVPLLPGLTTYRALFELAVERSLAGLTTLVVAASMALALAAGVVLGEYLAQPVRYGLGRLERRFAGPRMAGPLRPTRRRLE